MYSFIIYILDKKLLLFCLYEAFPSFIYFHIFSFLMQSIEKKIIHMQYYLIIAVTLHYCIFVTLQYYYDVSLQSS